MKNFWAFENRYTITAILRSRTALSIGSRGSLMPVGSDLPVIKTPDGMPFIPGSSLKGVLRAYTERLLRSLGSAGKRIHGEILSACDPLDDNNRCITAQAKEEILRRVGRDGHFDEAFTQQLWQKSCTACRLFGSQWLASRVSFQDALLRNRDSLPRLTEIRDGVGIDRDLGSAKPNIKFDFETVPPGAEFELRIVLENAETWEVALVLTGLETLGNGNLAIGGKTTRGLGWMEVDQLRIERVRAEDVLTLLTGQPGTLLTVDELRQALVANIE